MVRTMTFLPAEDHAVVSCPTCGTAVTVPNLPVLDLAFDRGARDRIQRGNVVLAACDACGHEVEPDGMLVLMNSEQRWAVVRVPGTQEDVLASPGLRERFDMLRADGFTIRTVRDTRQLLEKARVLDLELDDRVIEYLKAKLLEAEPDGAHASFVSLDADELGRPCLLLAVTEATERAASSYLTISRDEHDAAIDDVRVAVASRNEPEGLTRVDAIYGRELARILAEYHRRTEW